MRGATGTARTVGSGGGDDGELMRGCADTTSERTTFGSLYCPDERNKGHNGMYGPGLNEGNDMSGYGHGAGQPGSPGAGHNGMYGPGLGDGNDGAGFGHGASQPSSPSPMRFDMAAPRSPTMRHKNEGPQAPKPTSFGQVKRRAQKFMRGAVKYQRCGRDEAGRRLACCFRNQQGDPCLAVGTFNRPLQLCSRHGCRHYTCHRPGHRYPALQVDAGEASRCSHCREDHAVPGDQHQAL